MHSELWIQLKQTRLFDSLALKSQHGTITSLWVHSADFGYLNMLVLSPLWLFFLIQPQTKYFDTVAQTTYYSTDPASYNMKRTEKPTFRLSVVPE